MQTIYLKATDENALWTSLASVGLAEQQLDMDDPLNQRPEDADMDWQPSGAMKWQQKTGYDLDIIGDIWKPTGETETDADGFQRPVMEKLDGYHANIRLWNGEWDQEFLDKLPTIQKPNNPVRVWA